jgi:hypothetical protein
MTISPRYLSRYPRQGKVAILCEGDLAGYEADLLEKWFARQTPPLFIDVWPCGTKTAIFGMADAVGRAIPFSVIEDRDYRSLEQARNDCDASLKDRKDRGAHVRSWRTWNRHEIENYFIEPEVVTPVLARWFGASEADVVARMEQVITLSAVDQAAQYALSNLRSSLPDAQKTVGGLPRADARPQWSDKTRTIVAPARELVEQKLTEVVQASSKRFTEKSQKVDPAIILGSFRIQADIWSKVKLSDQAWRCDWAGKEILLSVCRWLAGEFGWPTENGGARQSVIWSRLTRQQCDEKDREMAFSLEKDLTVAFLQYLESARDSDIRKEWNEIVEQVS